MPKSPSPPLSCGVQKHHRLARRAKGVLDRVHRDPRTLLRWHGSWRAAGGRILVAGGQAAAELAVLTRASPQERRSLVKSYSSLMS